MGFWGFGATLALCKSAWLGFTLRFGLAMSSFGGFGGLGLGVEGPQNKKEPLRPKAEAPKTPEDPNPKPRNELQSCQFPGDGSGSWWLRERSVVKGLSFGFQGLGF